MGTLTILVFIFVGILHVFRSIASYYEGFDSREDLAICVIFILLGLVGVKDLISHTGSIHIYGVGLLLVSILEVFRLKYETDVPKNFRYLGIFCTFSLSVIFILSYLDIIDHTPL